MIQIVPEYEDQEEYYDDLEAPDEGEQAQANLNLMEVQTVRSGEPALSGTLPDTAAATTANNITYIMGEAIGDKVGRKKKKRDTS